MSSDKQRKVSKLAKWDPCLKERKTELPPVSLKIAARKATSIKDLLQIRFKNWTFRIRKKLLQDVTATSLTIFSLHLLKYVYLIVLFITQYELVFDLSY